MDSAELNLTTKILGYGRLLFVHLEPGRIDMRLIGEMEALGSGFENMHFIDGYPSDEALRRGRFQYLVAEPALGAEWDIADAGISEASVLVRLEGRELDSLLVYEKQLRGLVEARGGHVQTRAGVTKERSYTSYAMTQFAYARALPPKRGDVCQFGVVTPQSKTPEWWAMDWMRRESLFLPRYDEGGRMAAKGHALAAAPGIPCITRRLFHSAGGYGLPTGYDFIGYFEFAEVEASVFRQVMAGLRDRRENPEWEYVREGPEWWGRRVGHAGELW